MVIVLMFSRVTQQIKVTVPLLLIVAIATLIVRSS